MHNDLASTPRAFKSLLPSAFAVMFATTAFGIGHPQDRPHRKDDSTVLSVREPSTNSRQFQVTPGAEVTTMVLNEVSEEISFSDGSVLGLGSDWLTLADFPQNWIKAVQEIDKFSSFEAGWHGEGSSALSLETETEARELLYRLAWAQPVGLVPLVGLDSDGFVVLTWDYPALVGSLSVFGDGTIAYYIERGDVVLENGETYLASPLPKAFLTILEA